jgi:thiamine biosynthesis lipoprotein
VTGPPVKVSQDLLAILVRSQDLARRSNGAFDVTAGPLVKLWRNTRKSGILPSVGELSAARKLVGWRNVTIDPKAGTVRLALPGMQLDLGGIAKGFACDEAIRVLKRDGVSSALVEMGGDIAVSGPPPGKPGWEIEVANAPGPSKRIVVLKNAGISSSGDTEQFVEIGGVRYSHIVDPRTGLGLTDRIAVTVIARDCATSDGLSTAVSVLGERKGCALVRTYRGASVYTRRATPTP